MIMLVIIFFALQYRLWFGQGSYLQAWRLRHQIELQAKDNNDLQQRNGVLQAEVDDLKQGHQAIEEHARSDLGMVKKNETFYQLLPKGNENNNNDNN